MSVFAGPEISTDGLVLSLDAGNTKSYPGSGTTWSDLSGNGNTGTLTNGPTFDSNNLGGILCDGVNDYISLSNNTYTKFYHDQPWTISFFAKIVSYNLTYPGFIVLGAASGSGILIYYYSSPTSSVLWKHNNAQTQFTTWDVGSIKQVTLTYSGSGNVTAYTNGSGATNVGSMNSTESSSSLLLGSGDERGNVIIYNFMKFNRALTATEVSQNFNALRGRYGI